MSTVIDMNKHPDLYPAADIVLGALQFGRDLIKELLSSLTPEQLAAKPEGFSNDIATLLVHIPAIEIRFSHMIQGKELPADLAAEFLLDQPQSPLPRPVGETAASLQAKLDKGLEYVREMLAGLKAEDLDRTVPARPGVSYSVRWMVGLLPIHQSQHFGQMQMLLKHIKA